MRASSWDVSSVDPLSTTITSVSGRWVRLKVSRQRRVSSHLFQARKSKDAFRTSDLPRTINGLKRSPERCHQLIDLGLVKKRGFLPLLNRKDRRRGPRGDVPYLRRFGRSRTKLQPHGTQLLARGSAGEQASPAEKPTEEGSRVGGD